MSKLCHQCGQILADNELYCRSCGAKQASAGYVSGKQPVMTESMQHPVGVRQESAQQYGNQQNYYQPPRNNGYQAPQNYYQQPAAPAHAKKSKKGLVIGLISVILVAAILISLVFVFGSSTKVKQNSPEKLLDSACSILEKSANSKKMFSEKELKSILEYQLGNESGKYMVKGYYNIVASYLVNPSATSKLSVTFGTDLHINYVINSTTIVEPDEYQYYINTQYGVSLSDIQELDLYDLSVTITGNLHSETTSMRLPLAKAKGNWYFVLGQQMDPAGLTRSYY